MSELQKKVNAAIKVLKMAEADASEREDREVHIPIYPKIGGVLLKIRQL